VNWSRTNADNRPTLERFGADSIHNNSKLDDAEIQNIREFGYRAPRFFANFRFFVQTAPDFSVREAHCYELGQTGLAARVSSPLMPGSIVTLLLTLPGQCITLRICARVIHQQGFDHGFAFIFSGAEQQNYLRQYFSCLQLP
jgi:hypothetical protein